MSKRIYRKNACGLRLTSFSVKVKETDLWIALSTEAYNKDLPSEVEQLVFNHRLLLEQYLDDNPFYKSAFEPCLPVGNPPDLFRIMSNAANRAGVGPMAAVAGAFAETVGRYLQQVAPEVVVENGGDIYIKALAPMNVGLYAGNSPLSEKLALKINPEQTPLGICTSSGIVGPSFSFGQAEAAVALSQSTPLADAVATAIGNRIKDAPDLEPAVEYARSIKGITGALAVYRGKIAAWGELELVRTG